MKFYKEIGFKTYVEANNPPIVFFDKDGTKLELFSQEDLSNEINPTNPSVINTGFSGITLASTLKLKLKWMNLLNWLSLLVGRSRNNLNLRIGAGIVATTKILTVTIGKLHMVIAGSSMIITC